MSRPAPSFVPRLPFLALCTLLAVPAAWGAPAAAAPPDDLTAAEAGRLARLALDCVGREYPNKIGHVMNTDADVKPPRDLTPAFFGCFDWHSSVHGHWLLARLTRTTPLAPFAPEARAALGRSLSAANLAVEARYLDGPGRASWERPYGLAWLLQLAAELREWDDPDAKRWAQSLAPLESAAARRLAAWLPKLPYPIREGEHSQTAFAFGLVLDWARVSGDRDLARLVESRSLAFHAKDRACPLAYEPSGQDFLSPCLGEADLMRRVLPQAAYSKWLGTFLPQIPRTNAPWLAPAVSTDRSDGKLAHLDGLNLSRAWMLEGIASALPKGDPRLPALRATAAAHRKAGLEAATGEHYEGGHWLGTFAAYLVTGRGLGAPR
jgi:hypothetical protein